MEQRTFIVSCWPLFGYDHNSNTTAFYQDHHVQASDANSAALVADYECIPWTRSSFLSGRSFIGNVKSGRRHMVTPVEE